MRKRQPQAFQPLTTKELIMQSSKVSPTVINGIEFYVSHDGKQAGMSASSLAQLCGVNVSTITKRVLDTFTDLPKTTHKALESFAGKDLYFAFPTSNAAKPILAEACACIIEYYAFDSKEPNETARKYYRAFAKAGIHTWILAQTGYEIQPVHPIEPDLSNLSFMKAASAALVRHIQQQENLSNRPGLKNIVEDLSTFNYKAIAPPKLTLREYLKTKGIELDKAQTSDLAGIVSSIYKAHNTKMPNKIYQIYKHSDGTRSRQKVYGYSVEDYAIIDAGLEFLGLG